MRKTTGLLLAAGMLAAVSLTGCGAATSASCDPQWARGGLADLVDVSGGFGDNVDVSFPVPLQQSAKATTAVVQAGDGAVVHQGQFADARVTIVDGASGETIDRGTITLLVDETEPHFATAAECAPIGSRIVAVGPASELIGSAFLAANAIQIDPGSTIVYVVDVMGAYLGRADGADRLPENGLPTVSLAPDGRPGLTFTNSPAPDDLRVSVLKEGSGAVVQEGDTVVLHYTSASWRTHKVLLSSWTSGRPVIVSAKEGEKDASGEFTMTAGYAAAVIGQPVGSQVLVSVPAEGDGDPIIAVFDVLGIKENG